jgi:Glycosyl-4,4'-diaponeurosporenoate acyltransferase
MLRAVDRTWLLVGATLVAVPRAAAGLVLIAAPLLAFVWAIDAGRPLAEMACVFLLASAVGVLGLQLPDAYFRPHRFEREGQLYIPLGVIPFKHYLTWRDPCLRTLRQGEPRPKVGPGAESLRGFLGQMRLNESVHLALLLASAPPAVYAFACSWWGLGAFLCVANVVFNLYPVLVQRYNRPRVLRLLADRGSSAAGN